MSAIFQTYSKPFSLMKIFVFKFKFHWSCSKGSNQHVNMGSDNGLALYKWHAITWTNDGSLYWCTYASSSLNMFHTNLAKDVQYVPWMYNMSHGCAICPMDVQYVPWDMVWQPWLLFLDYPSFQVHVVYLPVSLRKLHFHWGIVYLPQSKISQGRTITKHNKTWTRSKSHHCLGTTSGTIFHHNSNFMEISLCSHPRWGKLITMNFFAHGTTAVMSWHIENFAAIRFLAMELH